MFGKAKTSNENNKIGKRTKAKKRGVLALSLLLIAAMVLPQAALATDGGASVHNAVLGASNATNVETSTTTPLENSGGGGQPIR